MIHHTNTITYSASKTPGSVLVLTHIFHNPVISQWITFLSHLIVYFRWVTQTHSLAVGRTNRLSLISEVDCYIYTVCMTKYILNWSRKDVKTEKASFTQQKRFPFTSLTHISNSYICLTGIHLYVWY